MKKEFSIKELIDQDWLSVTHGARDFHYSQERRDYKISGVREFTLSEIIKYAKFTYFDVNRGQRLLTIMALRIENSGHFKLTERWRISVSSTPQLYTIGWFLSFLVKGYKEECQVFRTSFHPVTGLDDSKIEEIKTHLNISIQDVTHMEVFY
jgi:hypothetical protein